jgi:hypothetical protein
LKIHKRIISHVYSTQGSSRVHLLHRFLDIGFVVAIDLRQ